MPHHVFREDFSEAKVNDFFDEHLFGFKDIWEKIEYRILATSDGMLIALALYLLPKGKNSGLPSAKPPNAEPFRYYKGDVPFKKATIMKIVHQFIKEPPCYLEFASDKFFMWGTPQSNFEYVNFFQPLERKPYQLSFPIILEKRIEDTEAQMLRYFYGLSENRIKMQSGLSLEDHIRKWIGDSTKFFKPADYSAVGTYLTIHAPIWIVPKNPTLSGNVLEFSINKPKKLVSKLIRCKMRLNNVEKKLKFKFENKRSLLKTEVDLPDTPRKIQLQVLCKNFLIYSHDIFNSGILNPIARQLEIKRKQSLEQRITNFKAENPGIKRFEHVIMDLFSSLGFVCIHIGKDQTKPDIAAFFKNDTGLTECLVIECSESVKKHSEMETLFKRSKEVLKQLDCKTYPVFVTDASNDEIRKQGTYERIMLLAKEQLMELMGMAQRNEPLEKTLKFLEMRIVPPRDYDFDITLSQPAEAIVSVYLDF